MALPAVSRARDVLAGSVSQVPLRAYLFDRVTHQLTDHPTPPSWLERPDPDRTRNAFMADVLDDLIFHRCSLARITARDATGYPLAFQWVPFAEATPQLTRDRRSVAAWRWGDLEIAARDMMMIESPQSAALSHGWRAIDHATRLEAAAARFADTEVPAGWLKQTGGVALTSAEQTTMADQFARARQERTVAMLSEHVEWHESSYDPQRLQLTESRQHSATDLARIMNVPAAIVHAPSNDSLTYANAQDQRADLWAFGLAPLAAAIAATMSGPNITPRGTVVRFDPTDLLADPFADAENMTGRTDERTPEPTPSSA